MWKVGTVVLYNENDVGLIGTYGNLDDTTLGDAAAGTFQDERDRKANKRHVGHDDRRGLARYHLEHLACQAALEYIDHACRLGGQVALGLRLGGQGRLHAVEHDLHARGLVGHGALESLTLHGVFGAHRQERVAQGMDGLNG